MAGGSNGPPELNGAAYAYPSKTFAEVRGDIYQRMGWIDPFANPPRKTLAELISSVILTLGFPAAELPYVAQRTLAQLREAVIARTGFAVQAASPPPGLATLINDIINEAQQTVFRRIEVDRSGLVAFPTRMTSDSDQSSGVLDYVPILMLATALAKAHYAEDDAKAYFDMYERNLSNRAQLRPPNLDESVTDLIKEAQQDVYRRYELGADVYALSPFALTTDLCTLDYKPIQSLATARAKALYGQKDAQVYFDAYERYMADTIRRFPPDAPGVVARAITSAQTQLYHRYAILRTEKWFSWETVVGQRFYDVPKISGGSLDFRRISWVGYADEQGSWLPLHSGIRPEYFTDDQQGPPDCYELRETLEIWPEPDSTEYTIWIKGHLGLASFENDTDVTTLDPEPITLMALGTVKNHYKHPDASAIFKQLEVHIGNLNAGTFGLKRFIPNAPPAYAGDPCPVLPMPRVTFDRP
jgi:hypothetical protein